jgi:protoheme IX farnesyltransferase
MSSLAPAATEVSRSWPQAVARIRGYVALTKPRIVELLLITTVPTMFVAAGGVPSGWLVAATIVGGTLAAGGANAINMYVDRDIDRVMKRTRHRPLVTGAVSPRGALFFSVGLEVVAFAELWGLVNLLSAVLALSAAAFYVFVYTLWLKRTSTQNIVIGGAAGAVPVLVGWAAVTGTLGLAPLVLFGIIFLWTPPHFWALAVKYRDDYIAAKVPMLPSVSSLGRASRDILAYTVALWALTLLLVPVAHMGYLYLASALVLGAVFVAYAVRLALEPTGRAAMRLFGYSITYLAALFLAMGADVLVRHG